MSETIAVETDVAFTGAPRAAATKRYPWASLTTAVDPTSKVWAQAFFVPAKEDGTLRRPVAPKDGRQYTMRAADRDGVKGILVGYVGAKQAKAPKAADATTENTGF